MLILLLKGHFDYIPKRGRKTHYTNKTETKLFYKQKVHQDYHKRLNQGEEVIDYDNKELLKSKKYFIGLFGSRRMGAMPKRICFYSMMQRLEY
jgi:hypothetical protein